jgi:23S rRNA (uracil747-C5)-methyltransferase
MVVGGSIERPELGIVTPTFEVTDLSECPLHDPSITAVLETLKQVIQERSIPPYNISSRRGELKGVTIMRTMGGAQGILRFIMRSTESLPRIKKALPLLRERHPWLRVVSCNIQPLPAAVPEGNEEHIITEEVFVEEQYGPVLVYFAPQSFMQVTHEIAQALYAKVARITAEVRPDRMLDLFCGVGGFSVSTAPYAKSITGLELSESAVLCATRAAAHAGASHISFRVEDVDRNTAVDGYNLVVVNPPRRGIAPQLINRLLAASPETILYSSCNPETLVRDLALLGSCYNVTSISPFDMFPLTAHVEVLAHLAIR